MRRNGLTFSGVGNGGASGGPGGGPGADGGHGGGGGGLSGVSSYRSASHLDHWVLQVAVHMVLSLLITMMTTGLLVEVVAVVLLLGWDLFLGVI